MDTLIQITHNETQAEMQDVIVAEAANKFLFGKKLMSYVRSLMGGARSATVVLGVNAAKASGTFTGSTVVATNTAIINGVTFTCVASGATGNQFNVGADDTETMANLATAINASATALIDGYVTASSALAVCTITADKPGINGNCMTISATGAITASGARLTAGDDGAVTRTNYFGTAA